MNEIDRQMLRGAWDLAGGLGPVYPVSRDKVPLISGGYTRATRDYKVIAAWFHRFPDANVGVRLDGMIVIDIDTEDAELYLLQLQAEYGELPETRQAKSSRGRHLYYRVPRGVEIQSSQKMLAPGIDVVGTGCPVIAPPSIHESGHVYRWLNRLPVAPLPEKWVVLCKFIRVLRKSQPEVLDV